MATIMDETAEKFPIPNRTIAQRMSALDKANVIRTRRARLKKNIKAGYESIETLLLDPPEYIETMRVWDLLLMVPKYGRVKVNKTFSQLVISPRKTVGGLSQRQRDEMIRLMRQ